MTDPGGPYAGPPPTGPAWGPPPGWGPAPGFGPAQGPGHGYGHEYGHGYGYGYGHGYGAGWGGPGPWAPFPAAPRRPGTVTGAAVLSFVQFGLVLVATLYLFLIAMLVGTLTGLPDAQVPPEFSGLAEEASVLAVLQLVADVLLLVAAIRVLRHRGRGTWRLLVAGLAAHVVLAGYWFVRLLVLRGQVPGDVAGALGSLTCYSVLYAAVPLVALGLVLFGSGRRWLDPAPAPGGPAPG